MDLDDNNQEYYGGYDDAADVARIIVTEGLSVNSAAETNECTLGEVIQMCQVVDEEDKLMDEEIAQEIELAEHIYQSTHREHKYSVYGEMDPDFDDYIPADPNDDSECHTPGKMIVFRQGFEPTFEFKQDHILCNDLNATIEDLMIFMSREHCQEIVRFRYIDAAPPVASTDGSVTLSQIRPFLGYKFTVLYFVKPLQPQNTQNIEPSHMSNLFYKTIKIAYTKQQKKLLRHPMKYMR